MRRLLLLTLLLFQQPLFAAGPDTLALQPALLRLQVLGDSMLSGKSDSIKLASETAFSTLTDSLLKREGGSLLSFHQVKAMSLTKSPDNHLRIYNWMLLLEGGNNYRFYGRVLAKQEKKAPYRLYRLQEKKYSDNEAVSLLKLDSTNWLGSVYYKIIQQRYDKKTTYVALGWAPQSLQTTRKIIEPIVIGINKVTFGAPVLKEKGKKTKTRVIFEYNARATMSLRYEEKNDRIVFDHLAPSDPRPESKGIYSMYGPDLSYDGYEFVSGSWIFRPDLKLNNSDLNEGKEGKFFGK
jgi:hypothetical protein